MALSYRENWLRTVRRTGPDRMPYAIYLSNASWEALGAELEEVVLRHPRTWPSFRKGSVDWNDLRYEGIEDPSGDFVDHWGSIWRTSKAGFTGVVVQPVLADGSKLDSFTSPDAATYNGGILPVDWAAARRRIAEAKARGQIAHGGLDHGYHMLRLEYLRGFENLMCDLALDTPEIRRLVERVHSLNRQAVRNWIRAGAEVVGLPEDLGSQQGSFLGPKLFRKWVTPYHKELHGMAHAAGCLTSFHCDGNIMDVADQIVEIGADVFNPQDCANGVEALARAFKGRLCLNLDFDRQHAIPFGTRRQIEELIELEIKTLGSREGGLMMTVEVRGEVPPANVDAIAAALETWSTYWFS
jgi:uroporphyrinogen decarboxylase